MNYIHIPETTETFYASKHFQELQHIAWIDSWFSQKNNEEFPLVSAKAALVFTMISV